VGGVVFVEKPTKEEGAAQAKRTGEERRGERAQGHDTGQNYQAGKGEKFRRKIAMKLV